MTASESDDPAWTKSPPSAYDIVSCWYPETDDGSEPGTKLRPALVTAVLQGQTTGAYACRVAYGTKTLNIIKRQTVDLIISASSFGGTPETD